MTPLYRELQSLKEAASAATAVESAARALSARIFVECGQDGWLAMAREFATMRALAGVFPEERYAAEIAVLKNEDAVAIQSDRTAPRPGDRLTAAQLWDAPDGTVVRHPHDATLRFERMDGGWYMTASSTPSVDLLLGGFWLLVRWGRA